MYEPWSRVLREVARYNPALYEDVAAQDLREVLLSFEAMVRERELVAFRHSQLLFVLGGTGDKTPPKMPDILRDD